MERGVRLVRWYIRGGDVFENPIRPDNLEDALQEIRDAMQIRKDYDYYRGVYIEFNTPLNAERETQ